MAECSISSAHLGWAFYNNRESAEAQKPAFYFLIIYSDLQRLSETNDPMVLLGYNAATAAKNSANHSLPSLQSI